MNIELLTRGYFKKFSLLAILLTCLTLNSQAQKNSLPETDGAFFAISVKDLDESVNWYTKHLGFTVVSKGGNDQRKGALLTRPGTVLEIGEFSSAIQRNELRTDLESHEIHGIFKIGFTTKDIDAMFEQLKDSDVEIFFQIVDASDGNRTFGIKDLEGNIIQFFGK